MGWIHVGRGITSFADATPLPLDHGRRDASHPFAPVPHYSTDIAAAWEVVERLRADHGDYSVIVCWAHETQQWVCSDFDSMTWEGAGETAPLAICRAALKAVGV